MRDEESFTQKMQKATRIKESALGQKTPKAVLRDEYSLKQKTLKEALISHKDHTNLVNMKNKTSSETDDYKNSMTLKEFLDYFNKQDMTSGRLYGN